MSGRPVCQLFYQDNLCCWGSTTIIFRLVISNMYAFSYWHTYFDTAFLSHPLKVSSDLIVDLKINQSVCQWPPLPILPQLTKAFTLLQSYILTESNWIGSRCTEAEIRQIETKLNVLIINLQVQKKYGQQFWGQTYRRVQSSVVHFYSFFKRLVEAALPQDCENLLDAISKNKLIISMQNLERFINELLPLIRPIHTYMFREDFKEETHLTEKLFKQWTKLLTTLPQIKRQQLKEVPRLMEYICVVNPLETNQILFSPQRSPSNRSRNATATDKVKSPQEVVETDSVRQRKNKVTLAASKKRSLDTARVQSPPRPMEETLSLFKFKEKVRKPSCFNLIKKKTLATIDTKDKTVTQFERSPTRDLGIMIIDNDNDYSPVKKHRTGTYAEMRSKNTTYGEQPRTREATMKSPTTRKTLITKLFNHTDNMQHEREEKIVNKKPVVKVPIRLQTFSQTLNPATGKLRGWGFVREWFQSRLAARRIKKLIQF